MSTDWDGTTRREVDRHPDREPLRRPSRREHPDRSHEHAVAERHRGSRNDKLAREGRAAIGGR